MAANRYFFDKVYPFVKVVTLLVVLLLLLVDFIPGIYAVDVTGELPDEILELCEQRGRVVRPKSNKN